MGFGECKALDTWALDRVSCTCAGWAVPPQNLSVQNPTTKNLSPWAPRGAQRPFLPAKSES